MASRMRTHGTGTIMRRPNGRFTAQVSDERTGKTPGRRDLPDPPRRRNRDRHRERMDHRDPLRRGVLGASACGNARFRPYRERRRCR